MVELFRQAFEKVFLMILFYEQPALHRIIISCNPVSSTQRALTDVLTSQISLFWFINLLGWGHGWYQLLWSSEAERNSWYIWMNLVQDIVNTPGWWADPNEMKFNRTEREVLHYVPGKNAQGRRTNHLYEKASNGRKNELQCSQYLEEAVHGPTSPLVHRGAPAGLSRGLTGHMLKGVSVLWYVSMYLINN